MKKKTKWVICAVSALTAIFCLAFGGRATYQGVQAEEYVLKDVKEAYCLGETMIVKEEMDIDVNGTNIKGVNPKFVTPDGIVYGGGSYLLTEPGKYELYYFADYQGKEISASKTIIVNEYSWAYSPTSTAEYGELTRKEKIANQEDRVAEGIILDLANGDTFTFAKKLNIAGLKELDICQIYPDLREETTDEASVSMVTCRVVDSYNPEIFVEVYVWAEPNGLFYCGAGANNQPLGGLLERSESGNVTFEGTRWTFSNRPRYTPTLAYGKYCSNSLNCNTEGFAEVGGMKFTMDLETNRINLTSQMANRVPTLYPLVTDLDSEELYGENIFKGFISDEVYAVIECKRYVAPSINLQIESLLGFKGEDLKMVAVTDNKAPEVTLKVDKTDEGGVYVVKGQEYVIPTQVEVNDSAYNNDMQINVYYNYGTSRQSFVYSKDGKFIPTKDGKYTVEYKATDIYGNSGVATLDLIVVDGDHGIELEEPKFEEFVLLQENIFPQIKATGKNKDISCEVYIKTPNEEKIVLGNRLAYIPEQAGEYEIVYTFKDNVYTRVYSYKMTATIGDSSFLQKEEPQLPAYFIKDASYILEPLRVQTLGAKGLEEKETTVHISVDGGAYEVVNSVDAIKIEGSTKICVKYMYNDKVVNVYERKIVDVAYGDKDGRDYTAYFQGDYTGVTKASLGFEYTFAGTKSIEEISYANLVSFRNFKLAFTIPQEKGNFRKISIILKEATNPYNSLVVAYEKTDKDVIYTVNETYGGFEIVNQTINGFGDMTATRSISYSTGVLTNDNGDMIQVTPFDTDLCILTVRIEDISSESSVKVNELNNQKFTRNYREQGAMLAVELPDRYYKLNEIYYIKPAGLSSVANIAHKKDVLLTVTAPNGEIAKDSKGIVLQNVPASQAYELPLSLPGHYHFSYSYSCELNTGLKQEITPMLLTVIDTIPPEAHFVGLGTEDLLTVNVGHTHKIREYVVTDNATQAEDMWIQVSVYNAVGTMLSVNRETYTFTKAGYYVVYLWCADADGNVTTTYYNILAK